MPTVATIVANAIAASLRILFLQPSGMRPIPVELTCFRMQWAGLHRTILDPVDRHDLRIVAAGENLIGIKEILDGQSRFEDFDAGIPHQPDDPRARDPRQK